MPVEAETLREAACQQRRAGGEQTELATMNFVNIRASFASRSMFGVRTLSKAKQPWSSVKMMMTFGLAAEAMDVQSPIASGIGFMGLPKLGSGNLRCQIELALRDDAGTARLEYPVPVLCCLRFARRMGTVR